MLYVCSLKVEQAQTVPVGDYYLVRFPFTGQPYDPHRMHASQQPDGVLASYPDPRSGLIWPARTGWGWLTAMVFWESGNATEYRAQFARDPLNLTTGIDTTGTTDQAPTPGGQYKHYDHQIFVHPQVPLGLRVRHSAKSPLRITLAEFKLAIETDVAPAEDE